MREFWNKYGWILVTLGGSLVFSVGFAFFLQPNDMSPGGISGLALVITELLGFGSVGTLSILINLPLFILGGMKISPNARPPKAIIADPAVLKDAPMEMLQAGYGDIVGKYSCLNDWKLSRVVNDEYFCQYVYDLTYEIDGEKQRGLYSFALISNANRIAGIKNFYKDVRLDDKTYLE